ncbi:MAG: hypothetical protein Kow00124_14410 [Anaerolineae bacterium]
MLPFHGEHLRYASAALIALALATAACAIPGSGTPEAGGLKGDEAVMGEEPTDETEDIGEAGEVSLTPEAGPTAPGEAARQGAADDLATLVNSSAALEQATIGRILSVQASNPGTEPVEVYIPCGLIFEPEDEAVQRLMAVQAERLRLAPGESRELTPLVACIDSDRGAPPVGASYIPGPGAEGDLETLAACLCEHDLSAEYGDDPMALMGVQLAVWAAADGFDTSGLAALPEDAAGVLGEFEEQFSWLVEMMIEPANQILTACGLVIEEGNK